MNNQENPSKEVKRTWGAKIPEELRERIESITEATGMRGEELLTNLIESFDLNQTKLAAPKFEKDIENLETYTSGIVSCIKNVIETAIDMEKINEEKYQKRIQDKENQLSKVNVEVSKLRNNNKVLDEQNIKYWHENRKLEDNLNDLKKSNEENAMKNKEIMELKDNLLQDKDNKIYSLNEEVSLLNLQIEESKKYKKEISALKNKIIEVEKLSLDKTNEIKAREIEIDGLTSQIDFFKDQVSISKTEHRTEIKELKASMKEDYDGRIKELEKMMEEVRSIKDEEISKLNIIN